MGKIDFEEALTYLNVVGLNPKKKDNFSRLRRGIALSITFTTVFLALLEIIFHYRGLETWARASESMIVQYQLFHKISVLLIHKKQISRLVEKSSQFWDFELFGDDFKMGTERIHKLFACFFRVYKILMVAMTLQYICRKIINTNGLPLAIIYGETDGFSATMDHVIFAFHSVGTTVVFFIIVGFDGLFFYFVGHILTELRMIKKSFEGTEKVDLKASIQHHQFVLKFIEEVNQVYSNMLLNQHLSCLFGICFGLFLLSKDGTPPNLAHITKYLPYIVSFITQTFTFCFFASLIASWTLEISDVVFYSGWNNGEAYKYKHEKIMVIQRAQKAVKLTIGRFGALNLESFTWVIKNAFSFYAFISTMSEELR